MSELKPCPFCGGKSAINQMSAIATGTRLFQVFCTKCQIRTLGILSIKSATEAWNTRHIPEGYTLVPVEPTADMIKEVRFEWEGSKHISHRIVQIYKAMIKAAQEG